MTNNRIPRVNLAQHEDNNNWGRNNTTDSPLLPKIQRPPGNCKPFSPITNKKLICALAHTRGENIYVTFRID